MMPPYILISILVLGVLVVGLIFVFALATRKSNTDLEPANQGERPQGYWMGSGLSIGVGLGVALGLVFDNLALGIAIGAGIGISIGAALEQKNKDSLRPPTEQERKMQTWGVAAGVLVLLILAGTIALLVFTRMR